MISAIHNISYLLFLRDHYIYLWFSSGGSYFVEITAYGTYTMHGNDTGYGAGSLDFIIFTVRNSSYGKVMFSQVSPPWAGTPLGGHPPGQTPPPPAENPLARHSPGKHPLARQPPGHTPPGQTPPRKTAKDGHCIGRYASYWNTFLFVEMLDSNTGPRQSRSLYHRHPVQCK